MKTIILKGFFILISILIVSSLIASVTYVIVGSKQSFGEYFISYFKFFIEFMTLFVAIGLCVGSSMYGLKKLYDKIFK